MCEVEGTRFARRLPPLLPALMGVLEAQAAYSSYAEAPLDADGDDQVRRSSLESLWC